MRLDKDSYKKAEGCLKRYNYNYLRIIELREDIMSIGSTNYDGMPKAPYNISDAVYNTYKRLCEDKELNYILDEYKAVERAIALVGEDCKKIFQIFYQKNKSKWLTIDELNLSEATFKRRKQELIYRVNDELDKIHHPNNPIKKNDKDIEKKRAVHYVPINQITIL